MYFEKCIITIVDKNGIDIIAQSRFIAILEDYKAFENEGRPYKIVLKRWIENGNLEKISKMSAFDCQWKIDASDIIHQTGNDGFDKEMVSVLLHKLLLGIGIIDSKFDWNKEFNIQEKPSNQVPSNSVTGKSLTNTEKQKSGKIHSQPVGNKQVINNNQFQNNNNTISLNATHNIVKKTKIRMALPFLIIFFILLGVLIIILRSNTQSKPEKSQVDEMVVNLDSTSYFKLALNYMENNNVDSAVYCLMNASRLGSTLAKDKLCNSYYDWETTDDIFVFQWIKAEAENGCPWAQDLYGECFDQGVNVKEDTKKAAEWYKLSAEQGCEWGQLNYANCYFEGKGVPQDFNEAVKWYTKAAEQGNNWAQNRLGVCYYNGNGVKQNYKEAVKWYTKAAEQGNADAQQNLGNCYYNGNGVKQNYKEAAKWYTKAAEQGNADAQCTIGWWYEIGLGVDKNKNTAKYWYNEASNQAAPTKKIKATMGHNWLEHNMNDRLVIHYSFAVENAIGKVLRVICTFKDEDKFLNKDLIDQNGEYCLFNGLVGTVSEPKLIEQDQQDVTGVVSIPYSELHYKSSYSVFGKEYAHRLSCRIKVVDICDEETVFNDDKLEFNYAYGSSSNGESIQPK